MTTTAPNSSNLGELVRIGSETPSAVKDEAFRIWVQSGRSWKRTSDATGVADSTLRNWGQVEGWEQRRQDIAASISPGLQPDTAFTLQLSANRAAKLLDRMTIEADEAGVKLDDRQVKALLGIIDRGAVTAMTTKHQSGIEAPSVATHETKQVELRNLSPDDLMQREQAARSRSRRQP